jgi:hypothetical protein
MVAYAQDLVDARTHRKNTTDPILTIAELVAAALLERLVIAKRPQVVDGYFNLNHSAPRNTL